MPNNSIEQNNQLSYVLDLIGGLPNAITYRLTELSNLQEQLRELEGTTCTGSTHWRDSKKASIGKKLYVLHGTNQACPVHGVPEHGKRLRIYVGVKPEKISQARAAIERQRHYRTLQRQLSRHNEVLSRILHRLKEIYWKLDYIVPQTDRGIMPYPTEEQPRETGETT